MTTASLQVHRLEIRVKALDQLDLKENMGSSLRGAFFDALWGRFCMNPEMPTCAQCPLKQSCPVSSLVAPLRDEPPWYRDVARPYTIQPPLQQARTLAKGDTFTFGLTIFGVRIELFPYVIMALQAMGRDGIGRRTEGRGWQRSRFEVEEVRAINPLSGSTRTIVTGTSSEFIFPDLPTTWEDAEKRAATMQTDQIALRLLTPLRLKVNKEFIKKPLLKPLVGRLLERHDVLARAYGGIPFEREECWRLITLAEQVEIYRDETRWTNLRSYSSRQQQGMWIGGITGMVVYKGDMRDLLPLLVWGTIIQAGKATTKGNGWYEIVEPIKNVSVSVEQKPQKREVAYRRIGILPGSGHFPIWRD